MAWFKRNKQGITTETSEKMETPDGVWFKCEKCKKTQPSVNLIQDGYVCPECDHHLRIGSLEYFSILYDEPPVELFGGLIAKDVLGFTDLKNYSDRLVDSRAKSKLNDAMKAAIGTVNGHKLVTACMDFEFIGGSMGVVVGEKISRCIDKAIEEKCGLLIISKSGGARMMESGFSLMQMAKTSAKLTLIAKAKLPYISLLTDPTTGGVTASFAMLGDIILAEPKSLIGFAGPRVIKETIKKNLPEGFQTAEFLLEKGFVDQIVHRKQLKSQIGKLLAFCGQ